MSPIYFIQHGQMLSILPKMSEKKAKSISAGTQREPLLNMFLEKTPVLDSMPSISCVINKPQLNTIHRVWLSHLLQISFSSLSSHFLECAPYFHTLSCTLLFLRLLCHLQQWNKCPFSYPPRVIRIPHFLWLGTGGNHKLGQMGVWLE